MRARLRYWLPPRCRIVSRCVLASAIFAQRLFMPRQGLLQISDSMLELVKDSRWWSAPELVSSPEVPQLLACHYVGLLPHVCPFPQPQDLYAVIWYMLNIVCLQVSANVQDVIDAELAKVGSWQLVSCLCI